MTKNLHSVKIFIAYSRLDENYLKELKKYLKPLRRKKNIQIWYDGEIVPGTKWETDIHKHLNEANIVLLLISANSLESDYFHSKEMLRALERHEKGEALVIPIILKYSLWMEEPELSTLQALPKDGKPISSWEDKSEVYTNIALGVKKSVELVRAGIEEKYQNLLQLAINQFQAQEWEAAKKSYEKAAKYKDSPKIQERIAAIHQKLKEAKKQALLEAEKQVILQKEHQDLLQLANTQFQSQEWKEAKKSYEKAAKYKDSPKIQERIAAINTELKKIAERARLENEKQATEKAEQEYQDLLQLANTQFQSQEWKEAKKSYTQAAKHKNTISIKKRITTINKILQRIKDQTRLESEKQAAAKKEQEYQTLLQLANTQFQSQEWKEAKKSYTKAAKHKNNAQIKRRITAINKKLKEITAQKKIQNLPPILQKLVNDMAIVDGGTFMMGCNSFLGLGCEANEKPSHEVKLTRFKIGKYLVTNEQWMAVMEKNHVLYFQINLMNIRLYPIK